jgi:uncharacterized protein
MLFVKKSKLPGSGKGLFTKDPIKRGEIVCEYEGEKLSWKECEARNSNMPKKKKGAYYFYINSRNCVDASHALDTFGRYANDAQGPQRVTGMRNNSRYEVIKGKPYIVASRNIKAGEEILVSYGKEYWEAMLEDSNS